ncbi:MAG: hypothetical protein ABEI74_00375 [Candidatus Pacearchaeota archaeon]
MESEKVEVDKKDLKKIKDDLSQIKRLLSKKGIIEERELTDQAESDLEEARNTPEKEYTSLEDVEREVNNGV